MYLEALQNIQFHIFMSANLTVNQSTLQFVLRTLHKKKKKILRQGEKGNNFKHGRTSSYQ